MNHENQLENVAEAMTSCLRYLLPDYRVSLTIIQIGRLCRSDDRADLLLCMLTIRGETVTDKCLTWVTSHQWCISYWSSGRAGE